MLTYKPQQLEKKLSYLYQQILQNQFLPLIKSELEKSLMYSSNYPVENSFKILKAYLMLANKEKLDINDITSIFLTSIGKLNDENTKNNLPIHIKNALAIPLPTTALNQKFIDYTRKIINTYPEYMIAYIIIKNTHENSKSISLNTANAKYLFTNINLLIDIPKMYTQEGFAKIYYFDIANINELIKANQWILGKHFVIRNSTTLIQAVKTRYLENYYQYWIKLTHALMIKPFSTTKEALFIINQLLNPLNFMYTYNQYLVTSLNKTLPISFLNSRKPHSSTTLIPKEISINEKTKINLLLKGIFKYLQNIDQSTNALKTSFTLFQEIIFDKNNIITQLVNYSQKLSFPMNIWLFQIAKNTQDLILNYSISYINNAWENDILPFYTHNILLKYPFNKNSKHEVEKTEFISFLRDEGIFETFFEKFFEKFINREPFSFKLKSFNHSLSPLSNKNLILLKQLIYIKNIFFKQGHLISHPYQFELIASSPNVHSISIINNKKKILFKQNTTNSYTIDWALNNELLIKIEDNKGNINTVEFKGPWSLLKFMDKGQLSTTKNPLIYEFEYQQAGYIVKFNIKIDELIQYFHQSEINNSQ
ncbi:MAG: hypothetical protein LEGION0398_MBIBDBAK_01388 [Legionellaceae bacterium]